MSRKIILLFAITSSIVSGQIDRSKFWNDDEVDSKALEWGLDNLKQRGAKSQNSTLDVHLNTIFNLPEPRGLEHIETLGAILRKAGDFNIYQVEKRFLVYDAAQKALREIPGHAEYYRDRILKAQEHLKAVWENEDFAGPAYVDYRSEQTYGFQTLSHLPSAETVRIYGELLSNHWVPPGNDSAPVSEKLMPLSDSAMVGLMKLPLRNKPFNGKLTSANLSETRAAWSQWHDGIKAGKRTFQFEGDPTEYDLNGPAPGQKVERIARDTKRERERAAGRREVSQGEAGTTVSVAESQSSAMLVPLLAAGALVLGTVVWYVARRRVLRCP